MFKNIFIIEDTDSDISELIDFLTLLPINRSQIIVEKDISHALDSIKKNCLAGEDYLAFIDVYWNKIERGITLAQSIRSIYRNIKIVAYTSSRQVDIKRITDNFHGFLDKESTDPHPSAIQCKELDIKYLEKLKDADSFIIKSYSAQESSKYKEHFMKNYFFKSIKEERVLGQFLVADFAKFSVKDDDQQLYRFKCLQNVFIKIGNLEKYRNLRIVYLPTGDGVALGIFEEKVYPYAVEIAFELLYELRSYNLHMELRVGIHFGPAYLIIGEKEEAQMIGPGINMAARVEAAGTVGKILVSEDYFRNFIESCGERYSLELNSTEEAEYQVKSQKFTAKYLSRGKIGE